MKKVVFYGIFSLAVLLGIFVYQYLSFKDGKVHVIFCNVGQGDGVIIREPGGKYFMVDSGPDEKILGCLERNMPFWERNIEIAFLSHPHMDHFVGYLTVFRRYGVRSFVREGLVNNTNTYMTLSNLVEKNDIQTRIGRVGDIYKTKSGMEFKIIGPSREFLHSTSPAGHIGESDGFANLIIALRYKNFEVLFTGDSQIEGLLEALEYEQSGSIDVMHVPHHGSKTGLSKEILGDIRPKAAVISVGKNNYGHPSREILDLLNKEKIKYFRTDRVGDVEIISDGERFWVSTQ